tara:strand:- start:539 stop:862 length:324 start_codon:yes stop_codon:yes gene_type:complete
MRAILFLSLFFASCSIRDKLLTNDSKPLTPNNSIHLKYDVNNDGNISQEEFKKIKDQKKLFNPYIDYQNPLAVFSFILLLVLSCCSLSYISSFINSVYIWFLNKIKK